MDEPSTSGGFLVSRRAIKANRKIGFNHFAFFRGYLEGISLTKLGEMYLETGDEPTLAKQTLDAIRQELISAARRRNQPAMARAIQVSPERLVLTVADVESSPNPTLDEFRYQVDPTGDFYREEELIEMFEKRFKTLQKAPGAIDRAERIRRIHRRQMAALTSLEGWLAAVPSKADPLESWLHEAVAARLNAASVYSVGDLLAFIDRYGRRWWERVQGLGEIGADRLASWLEANKTSLSASITDVVTADFKTLGKLKAKQRPLSFGVVPLPFLAIPEELSGPGGKNLDLPEVSGYKTDLEAIYAWLRTCDHNKNTYRAYRTQAERFYLWCLIGAGKSLSSINATDCENYLSFLQELDDYNPKIHVNEADEKAVRKRELLETWVSANKKKAPQWSEDWRPFAGKLNRISFSTVHTVLNTLFNWLVEQRYVLVNPWLATRRKAFAKRKIKADHALSLDQFKIVVKQCDWILNPEKKARMLLLLWLAFSTGLRRTELASARLGDLRYHSAQGDSFWELIVLGKGSKERSVPIPDYVIKLLQDYLEIRGHTQPILACNPYLPILTVLGDNDAAADELRNTHKKSMIDSDIRAELAEKPFGITGNAIYELLQRHFSAAAKNSEICDLADAPRLLDATTHWLRHTFATQALGTGSQLQDVADILGHTNIQTTTIYTNPSKQQKHRAADNLIALASK